MVLSVFVSFSYLSSFLRLVSSFLVYDLDRDRELELELELILLYDFRLDRDLDLLLFLDLRGEYFFFDLSIKPSVFNRFDLSEDSWLWDRLDLLYDLSLERFLL